MAISTDLSNLRVVVQDAIDKKQLGGAKFLRCVRHGVEAGDVDAALGELRSLAGQWFGAEPVQEHMTADDKGVARTMMLKWPAGQGAILTVSTVASSNPASIDMVLVGSRGTLYHES